MVEFSDVRADCYRNMESIEFLVHHFLSRALQVSPLAWLWQDIQQLLRFSLEITSFRRSTRS